MNKAHAAAHVGVPFAVVVGGSLATLAVIGPSSYRPDAASPPRSTVTVTQTPAPIAAPSPRHTPAPSPSTSGPQPAATVVAAAMRQAAMPSSSGSQSHTQGHPPATLSPSRAASCSGRILTVRALADRACVSIGGSR